MACLGSVLYDPSSAATAATSSLLAMTAIDTTNARITFTAPANGIVLVRIRGVLHGGNATVPIVLLGVLDGATVKGRQTPVMVGRPGSATTNHIAVEALFTITGLTPSQSYTFDAAYGVEEVVASSALKWGGPDDTTTNNAFGGLCFEIWETENLLAATMYDPGAAVSAATSTRIVMTALDTTNLRLTFTAPASGRVLVRMRGGAVVGATTYAQILLGVLDGASVTGKVCPLMGTCNTGSIAASNHHIPEAEFVVSGLTPSQSYTWDAAYGVDVLVASSNLKYGGPNNTTGDDAWGGFAYEIWEA